MKNETLRFSHIEAKNESPLTLRSFLSSSCADAQQFLKEGTSFIKDELTLLYAKAENHLQKMALPINNFLKDIKQMDREIEYESKKQSGLICEGNVVPLEQALLSPMEEN